MIFPRRLVDCKDFNLASFLFPSHLFLNFAPRHRRLVRIILTTNAEKKRRIYDQYGKEGLIGHNDNSYGGHHQRRRHDPFESEFIFGGGFPGFVFRDPDEVFREFFGGASPFDEFFNPGGQTRRHHHHTQNGHPGGSRQHQRAHHQPNIMSPFFSLSLMDDMFSPHGFGMNNGGFTSLSTFSNTGAMMASGGGGGGGNVRRISTSTSFVNGKKVTTKR